MIIVLSLYITACESEYVEIQYETDIDSNGIYLEYEEKGLIQIKSITGDSVTGIIKETDKRKLDKYLSGEGAK